jgi:hypothetical protein
MKRRQEIEQVEHPAMPMMHGPTPEGAGMLIHSMMLRLPPPGAVWPERDRHIWLDAVRQSFNLIYREMSDR